MIEKGKMEREREMILVVTVSQVAKKSRTVMTAKTRRAQLSEPSRRTHSHSIPHGFIFYRLFL